MRSWLSISTRHRSGNAEKPDPAIAAHSAKEVLPELHRCAGARRLSSSGTTRLGAAIVALHLGDATLVREMVQPQPGPVQRTVVTATLPNWHGPLDDWISAARASGDDALTASLCLGLGQLALETDDTSESNSGPGSFE